MVGCYIEIVSFWEVLASFIVKQSNSELQQVEVESSFFYSFVKFNMIGIQSFYSGGLGYEASELAVEGNEMS